MTSTHGLEELIDQLRKANAAVETLTTEWRKDIAALQAARLELAEWKTALEKSAANAGVAWKRIADALGYCKRHNHSGVNLAAHVYLNKVIEILEGTSDG